MPNKQEVTGDLARLLATENLIVEHRHCPTASFDIDERVLTLPMWDRASVDVYDMLIAHEVGHALFTPTEWIGVVDFPKSYLNVVEDARIEKMMKRKYRGLPKYFSAGYKELDSDDFFGHKSENINTFNLIDRINLHVKIGPFALIPFSEEEKNFVERVEECETFDEAVEISRDIYNWSKEQETKEIEEEITTKGEGQEENSEQGDSQQTDNSDAFGDDAADLNTPSYNKPENGEDEIEEDLTDSNHGGYNGADDVRTQNSFDEKLNKLNGSSNFRRRYIELPTIDYNNIVVDWKELHQHIDEHFYADSSVYKYSDAAYNEFRQKSRKDVNYLVKEFEMRKSADAYARASVSKTGVLNTNKLHTYSYNEDLFKRVTTVPDGKNHGMIFVLDWSGSMSNVLMDTLKQLFMLTDFCRKVQIPFDVYAFTNEYWSVHKEKAEEYYRNDRFDGIEEDKIYISSMFNMLNMISSRCNSRDYERQCRNIWRQAYCQQYYSEYSVAPGLGLSGTPLNEAIITLNEIIPRFRKQHSLQKLNVCILSDGESQPCSYGSPSDSNYSSGVKIFPRRVDTSCVLRDRQTGHIYSKFDDSWCSVSNVLISQVRHRNPDVNIIGYRVIDGNGFSQFVRDYGGWHQDVDALKKEYSKNRSVVVKKPISFSVIYAISSSSLSCKEDVQVSDNASKSEISKAFKTMIKSSMTNKKLLSSFVDHVC